MAPRRAPGRRARPGRATLLGSPKAPRTHPPCQSSTAQSDHDHTASPATRRHTAVRANQPSRARGRTTHQARVGDHRRRGRARRDSPSLATRRTTLASTRRLRRPRRPHRTRPRRPMDRRPIRQTSTNPTTRIGSVNAMRRLPDQAVYRLHSVSQIAPPEASPNPWLGRLRRARCAPPLPDDPAGRQHPWDPSSSGHFMIAAAAPAPNRAPLRSGPVPARKSPRRSLLRRSLISSATSRPPGAPPIRRLRRRPTGGSGTYSAALHSIARRGRGTVSGAQRATPGPYPPHLPAHAVLTN